MQLFRSSVDYLWNGWPIYLKVRTIGMHSRYKKKNDRENHKGGYEGQIEEPYLGEKM